VDGGVRARRFLAFHPWVLPLALGAAVLAVSVPLAVAVLAVGVTALIGARPTSDRLRLRHADLDQVDRMDGTTFELYLSELLRDHGYGVRHVGRVGDFGADLLIDADGQRAVVQAKRYRQAVGVNAVREAAAARAHYGAQRAIVVTNSWFTGPAVALARSNRVDLWNRETLATLAAGAPHRDAPSGAALLGRELVEGAWLLVKLLGVMVLAAAAGNVRRRRRQRRT
jgi:restriction system protein